MTLRDYIESLRHKTVAVIGIGVSNTPLLELLLAEGIWSSWAVSCIWARTI